MKGERSKDFMINVKKQKREADFQSFKESLEKFFKGLGKSRVFLWSVIIIAVPLGITHIVSIIRWIRSEDPFSFLICFLGSMLLFVIILSIVWAGIRLDDM
jgi:hypothetical protein